MAAFTLVELGAVIVASIVAGVVGVALVTSPSHCCTSPVLKDSSQLRGILQGMVMLAEANKGQFPLPSVIDSGNTTVAAQGEAKDTTANILSLMIYQGFFPVELTVSPLEVGNVDMMLTYQTSLPAAAIDPARAQWDPAFSADFTAKAPGNTSYAHTAPIGPRRQQWSLASGDATLAVLGARGPQVASVAPGPSGPVPTLAKARSNTLRMHRPRNRWQGNIGYQDNHVDLETEMAPEDVLYWVRGRSGADAFARDTLFYDEPDDASGGNAYLTITIPVAGVPGGKAIWD